MKPCLKHILALPEEFQDKLVKKVETLMKVGASQQDANRAALSALIDEAIDEMEAIEAALREQHPDLFVKPKDQAPEPATGRSSQPDSENPDIRFSRAELVNELKAMNRGLSKINQAVKLAANIDRAGKVIDAWRKLPARALMQSLPLPIGPQPHVLHMLGAPMQALRVDSSILRKVLIPEETTAGLPGSENDGKHAGEFEGVSGKEFIEALYRPMVVMQTQAKGEWEMILPLRSPKTGELMMVAVMKDAEIDGIKTSAIKSAYPKAELMERFLQVLDGTVPKKDMARMPTGKPLLYVDAGLWKSAMAEKQNPAELSRGGVLSAGESFAASSMQTRGVSAQGRSQDFQLQGRPDINLGARLVTGVGSDRLVPQRLDRANSQIRALLNNRSVAGYGDLLQFISDNYTGPAAELPRFSRFGAFDLPEFGAIAATQQALQDRYNRWKQAVDAVRKQGGSITEANDFYMAEERYWGQVATRNDEFGKEIEKFVEAVKADGLELSDVALYAYAKHARERNQHIAKQRESMPDGGSGMTNEAADEILTNAEEAGLSEALEQHAQTLYDWIDGTRDVLEKGGLISPDQRQAWDNTFRHYVPLRGREDLPEKKRIGAGFNIKGKEGFKAMGRKSEAKQIIEQIVQDRTRAYIRVGKNEVLRSFLGFVLDNPSPNLWQINAVESKPKEGVDANGDPIIEESQKLVADDRTVTVKDGGEEIHILIKDDALREQMQNLHVEQMPAILAALQWANSKIGAMLTSYNPVFVVLNGMRDFQAASMGMLQEAGFKGAGQFLASYSGAMKDAAMAEILGRPTAEYLEYKRAGGTTGYFGLNELGQTEKDLMALAKDAERGVANPIKLARAVAARVDDVNAAVEQATRFAAYKAARKSGMSIAKAASVSKNITVNFNRKGTMSSSLGALILFFNPAVQGAARLAQALASKKVMATLGTGTTALFFLALANAEFGGDDDDGTAFWDKVPKEVKERNIVIMRRPKRNERGTLEADYFKIPMAYGYNVFAAVANELADQYRHSSDPARGRKPIESAKNVAQALLGATIPANGVAQSLDTPASLVMVPFANAVGPLAQGALNVSSFGRPLHPDSPNEKDLPDSTKYSPGQAGTVFQKTAEQLNALTGGSKYEKGLIDVSPGALENAMRFWGGGLTSFALDLGNAFYARQHIERPEPDLRRLPFVKQLYGRIDDETDRWFGYDKLSEAEKAIQPMDSARRDGNSEAMDEIEKKYGSLAWSGAQVRAIREELSRLRKEERRVVADEDLSDSERYVRLVEIGGRVRQTLQRWNEAFNEAAREKPAQ